MDYKYDIREYQLHCVSILEALDKVCREHGLTYYITDGTLLGSVRHKGFIPWDDDIDIAMPREDYDKLISNAKEWLPERYNIVTHEYDENYPKYFAKMEDRDTTLVERFFLGYVGGIYIDMFALDAVPDSKLRRNLHFYKFNLVRRLLYFAYRNPYKHGHGIGASLMALFQKTLSRHKLHALAQRIITEYRGASDCNHVMTHDTGTCAYHKDMLGKPKLFEFEGKQFFGPCDAEKVLSSYYGADFMQLPPEEKRKTHTHDYCDFHKGYAGTTIDELRKR